MKEQDNHDAILYAIGEAKGELNRGVDGVNKRLDTLNSSVAKHELRLASQDVLNAQMTITQSQLVKELSAAKVNEDKITTYIQQTQGSVATFKWLAGFIGIGTIISLYLQIFK